MQSVLTAVTAVGFCTALMFPMRSIALWQAATGTAGPAEEEESLSRWMLSQLEPTGMMMSRDKLFSKLGNGFSTEVTLH